MADDALNAQAVNRMLSAGADVAQAFQQEILRLNNGYGALAVSAARTFETTTQLLTYNGGLNLFGNALQLNAATLNSNAVRDQPHSSYFAPTAVQPPNVFMVNPSNGTVTKP